MPYRVSWKFEEWSFCLGTSPAGREALSPARLERANKEHILLVTVPRPRQVTVGAAEILVLQSDKQQALALTPFVPVCC